MIVARTRSELDEGLDRLRRRGTTALVPTMGFLHEGHLSLVDRGRAEADAAVASVFVNPLQFAPEEDFERYPRDEARDLALLEGRGVDLVFAPSVEGMYPAGVPTVTVDPGPMGGALCGRYRPTHFRGVLTVVARLFGLIRPDVAVFGRKDLQQAVLIERMVRDLELGVRVVTAPISREDDGLARSSRNAYLEPAQRRSAAALSEGLRAAERAFDGGEREAGALRARAAEVWARHPAVEVQYLQVVDPLTLAEVARAEPGTVVAVAAHVGRTRLIDNVVLGEAGS